VHLHLGFASFAEYVERMLGYKPRSTEERLRVAEALEELPTLAEALRDGTISWSTVRELTRVANRENESAWLQVARGKTLRQIEELVAGHEPGDGPEDRYDPSLKRHVLRFEVSADTMAIFREAMAKIRRDAGSSLDDDASLLLVARQILGGPRDAGRANYQMAVTVCGSCDRGWLQGRGEQIEVNAEVVEMAGCDAQEIGSLGPAAHVGARARQDVPPAVRRQVMRRHGGKCAVPGCRHATFLDIHHVDRLSEGGTHDPDRLIVLCGAHHRAQHRGQLIIDGCAPKGFTFRHADGARYGGDIDPLVAAVHEEAFRALRSLGFRERETRSALERIRGAFSEPLSTEKVLRQALLALSENRPHAGAV
jgi:hypothetical protein